MSGSPPLPPGTRVGLNLVFLTPGATGGMETYARQLIPHLTATAPDVELVAFVNTAAASAPGPWHDVARCVELPVDARNRIEWVRAEQLLLPRAARAARIDLMHSFASTAPVWGPFRRVVTIHDLIYRTVPEAHPGLRSLGMRLLVPAAARRSHRIIVPAEVTRGDLERFLGTPPSKVDVIHHGISPPVIDAALPEERVRSQLDAGDRAIVLSASAKLAHKNLRRLIDAIASLPPPERPLLVLPGYPTPHEAELQAHVARGGLQNDVRFLGWVSEAELEGLYAAAACFVFPSLAEGFGFPVLEAMARGVPVACSGRGALAEVAGSAALLFDAESTASIAQAIRRLLGDTAEVGRLIVLGRERAASFLWDDSATKTLAAYGRALAAA
jgi:glycosyltransferase involved in cell wall biosynthesis